MKQIKAGPQNRGGPTSQLFDFKGEFAPPIGAAGRVETFEAQRADLSLKNKLSFFPNLRNPAWCKWARNSAPTFLFVVAATMAQPQSIDASRWSSSGEFNLAGSFTSASVWSQPFNRWSALDDFERAEPAAPVRPQSLDIDLSEGQIPALLNLVASVERSPEGFDGVHHRAHIKPPAPPTQLTVGQIFEWIEDTPNQQHAIGEYQIIPSTLAYLVEAEGIDQGALFDRDLQTRFALRLMTDAGLQEFLGGDVSADDFMDALARIWAGLPLASGQSAYAGIAGNRAVINRQNYETAFLSIFPR